MVTSFFDLQLNHRNIKNVTSTGYQNSLVLILTQIFAFNLIFKVGNQSKNDRAFNFKYRLPK